MKFLSQINVNTEYTLPIVDGNNGQVLTTDGNGAVYWGNVSAGVTNLDGLTDVILTSPSSGQLLRYGIPPGSGEANPVWYNFTPNYLTPSSSIDALSDVTISTATTGQILQWSGTQWVNATLSTVEYVSKVQHLVKCGVAVTKGQAVYVTSADGTNMIVGPASNASEATSSKVIGLAVSTGAINDQIFVVTEGLIAGLNTSTATAGDPVWLGTGGNLIFGLANKPVAPAHLVYLGVVTRVQSNNGEIFVNVQNGFELNELHDVLISSPSAGQLIRRDSDGLWKNWTPNYLTSLPTHNHDDRYYTESEIAGFFGGELEMAGYNATNWDTAYGWGNHATAGYLTSFTEADTLSSVTGRGNTTTTRIGVLTSTAINLATAGNLGTWIGGIQDGTTGWAISNNGIGLKADNTTYSGIAMGTGNGPIYFGRTLAGGTGTMASWLEVNSSGTANFKLSRPQHNGSNLALVSEIPTNLNQLTNGPGYITGYTETDTLASVIGRGSIATHAVFTGDAQSRVLYLRGAGNIIQFQDASSANKWEVVGRQDQFYIYKNDGTGSGYKYYIDAIGNHAITGDLSVSGGFSASGYNKSNWDTAYGWGNHATAGYLTSLPAHTHPYIAKAGESHDTVQPNNLGAGDGGFYTVANGYGASGGNDALIHIPYANNDWAHQLAFDWSTGNDQDMWFRTKNNGTWQGWRKVWHDGNFIDNSTNWNTAYNDRITAASVTGTSTKTLTLTQGDGGTVTATWTDYDTDNDAQVLTWTTPSKELEISNGNSITLDGLATEDYVLSQGFTTFQPWNSGTGSINYTAGNVGIGTTAPQKVLEVITPASNFASVGVNQIGVGQWTGIHFGYRESNANYRKSAIVFERTDLTANDAQGKIHILNGPQGNAGSATLADAKLTIAENGNVGIGTTSPGAKLHVVGNTYIQSGVLFVDTIAGYATNLVSIAANTNFTVPSGIITVAKDLGTNDYANIGQHNMQLRIRKASLDGGCAPRALELGVLDNGTGIIQANHCGIGYNTLSLNPVAGSVLINGQTAWHAGNDGAASGLDADLLDGQHGSYYQPASTAITTSNIGSQSVTYATNSTRLYASDSPYRYGDQYPYSMDMRYDGVYWNLSVTPATPSAVRVAYSDSSAYATSAGSATSASTALTVTGKSSISYAAHSAGANDYNLELYSSDTGDATKYVSLRFHQGSRYWGQIRYNNAGFRLTGGADDSLNNIYAGIYYATNGNSQEWNAAYNDRITAVSVTGAQTKTITLTQQDGGTLTATWTDYDTDNDAQTLSWDQGQTLLSISGGNDVTLTGLATEDYVNSQGFVTSSGTVAGVVRTVTGTNSAELVRGNMGDNDQARILVGATASNAGYLEIATADDGTEPIYVRQYTGVFSSLTRTATLLDGSGNTTFPGSLTIGGTFTENSSIRFKENIQPLEPALAKVEQLNPVTYTKITSQEEEIGLIAEEVAELFPEVVTYNEAGQPQGIQYQRLSVILLKAVQELTERVNKLENK